MFTLVGTDKKARAGILKTAHGDINTPVFAPIGTCGSVKAIDQETLEKKWMPILFWPIPTIFICGQDTIL